MCIVIDTCVICSVFNKDSDNHRDYEPVHKWIIRGAGFMVYGGTKYLKEVKSIRRYLGIIVELKNVGKVKEVDKSIVDCEEDIVKKLIPNGKCDDTHLIAIFRASGCKLLCSSDKKSDLYIKNSSLYNARQDPPKIYRYRNHKRLLCPAYIVNIRNLSQ